MTRLALILALLSCDYWDRVADADGTVYDCGDLELCYFADSADELGDLTGRSCSETGIGDRWWPGLTNLVGRGCRYVCPGQIGCNAKQGCYCPSSAPAMQPAGYISGATWTMLIGARVTTRDICDSELVRPAVACGRRRALDYDGCRWRCVPVLGKDERQ